MHNAWDPGLTSEIPPRLLPEVTIFRPESSTVDYKAAKEAAAFCGLKPAQMVSFTLERLILHALLIRVTADLSVPDGPNYEELGINLRGMVAKIYERYVTPELARLREAFDATRRDGEAEITTLLKTGIFERPVETRPATGLMGRLLGKVETVPPTNAPEELALKEWQAAFEEETDPKRKIALRSVITLIGSIKRARGRLFGDGLLLCKFATNIFMNIYGSQAVGRLIAPIVKEAAKAEGFRHLPAQSKPFFMNVKGASASGKSTIRPQQRALAEQLDVPWEDFALISPDYWRKSLLDYDSLGDDYKYAAMLTGQELEIIDKKLDAYMARKAANKEIPHLLIDRFRFDSFSTDHLGNRTTQLLTQFGDTVFLYFLVTPPAATVERAWNRGQETGRFKAVDDLLYHNIEAYTGMPQLFFSWMGATDKKIHFEFLDNSVALGERPRTIAYGWNDRMVVLDVEGLHNIDRYRAVNVEAERPEDVLLPAPELTFLERCVEEIPNLTIIDPMSGRVLSQAADGVWLDAPKVVRMSVEVLEKDRSLTLGDWG